jgi:hypothetical protein
MLRLLSFQSAEVIVGGLRHAAEEPVATCGGEPSWIDTRICPYRSPVGLPDAIGGVLIPAAVIAAHRLGAWSALTRCPPLPIRRKDTGGSGRPSPSDWPTPPCPASGRASALVGHGIASQPRNYGGVPIPRLSPEKLCAYMAPSRASPTSFAKTPSPRLTSFQPSRSSI